MNRPIANALYGATLGLALIWSHSTAAALFSLGGTIPVTANVFAVPVEISDAANVTFWQFDLHYNPSNVQINTSCDTSGVDVFCDLFSNPPPITEGNFFGSGRPFNTFNPGFILLDATSMAQIGQLLAVNDTLGTVPPGISGSGVLAFIEFVTVGTGPPGIAVSGEAPGPTVPEPATLLLVGTGLLLAPRRRFLRDVTRHQPNSCWRWCTRRSVDTRAA